MNSQNQTINYRKVKLEESGAIARFQYDMAKETEGKELIEDEVKKAVDFMYYNPNRGFYLVGATSEGDKAVSSELLTFGYDIYRSTNLWWFQSVFVEKEFRGLGIFKGMFHEVEKINKEQKYPLRLYVELENTRAQQVYQRLGMFDTNEIFLEDDFYFDNDKIKFQDSLKFQFTLATQEETEEFKTHIKNATIETLMNKQIDSIEKTLASIDFIQNQSNFEHIFVVKDLSNSKVIGYLPVFQEYSDWRNGNMIYIYDLRVLKDVQNQIDYVQLVSSFMHFIKKVYQPKIILTNIRWIIHETSPFKNTLLQAGLETAHYRVYEKNTF